MTPERAERLREVASKRQSTLTVILENVHDPHNIGAVLRSCDSVGLMEIYILYTEDKLTEERLDLSKRSSSGARKWLDVHMFRDVDACFQEVRKKYDQIFSTHISKDAHSLYQLDLTKSTALLFGNEHEGISKEAMAHSDGNFIIPQVGMVQSLNISVACAVSLYEAFRQRKASGFYDGKNPTPQGLQDKIFEEYIDRHERKVEQRIIYEKKS